MADLGDIADFKNGKALPKERYLDSGQWPVYGSNGEIARTDDILNAEKVISIGRVGAYCGAVYAIRTKSWVTDNAIIAEPKEGTDYDFLYYLLSSLQLNRTAIGSAQPLLTQGGLKVISLPEIPNYEQQKIIGKSLKALDDKIALNNQINETLESMAKAIFKEWFVDFGPVKSKTEGKKPFAMDNHTVSLFPDSFEDSELGLIPRGWSVSAVYDVADWQNGMAFKAIHFSDEGLPIVKIAELKSGIDGNTKRTNQDHEEKFKIKDNEILFSWSGSPDTSIDTFLWDKGDAWLNQHIFKVTARDTGKEFVYSLLKHLKPVFIETARNKQTTGLGHVTVADLKRLRVVLPTPEVVNAFKKIAEPLLSRYFLNLKENQSLVKARDLLLPKLISSELQLKEIAE